MNESSGLTESTPGADIFDFAGHRRFPDSVMTKSPFESLGMQMVARVFGGTLTESKNRPPALFSQRVVIGPFTVGTVPSAKVRLLVSGRTSKVANPPPVGWMPEMYFKKRYPG